MASGPVPGNMRSCTASEVLEQFWLVELTGDLTVGATDGITDTVYGVTQAEAASGAGVPVQHSGETYIKLGGTVTAGDRVSPKATADGVAIVAASGARACGIFLEGGVSGDIVRMQLGNNYNDELMT